MKILKVPISSVFPWDKNPRGIKPEDLERLKKQLLKLGVYKPLVCCPAGKKYETLGGNMRLLALKELGVKEVEISVVKPKDEAEKIEFALSDNDRAGYYEENELRELITPFMAQLDLADFKVDLGGALDLKGVVERAGPDPDGEGGGIDYESRYAVTVECKDEASQQETYDALVALGYKCRVVVV